MTKQRPDQKKPLPQAEATKQPTSTGLTDTSADHGSPGQTPSPALVLCGGRFSILRELGQGGMGTVYLAKDNVLKREVALKVPKIESDSRQRVVMERFLREAQSVARLNHSYIAKIFDVGESQGQSFLAMEFIKGQPLESLIGDGKQMPERDAALLVMRIAQAMQHSHSMQIIHRDIKPGNIMIADDGTPRVMDFGLSRIENDDSDRITRDGQIVGSPAYMSPEQVSGGRVDFRSDIFSLGCVFYEALAGVRPFSGTLTLVLLNISTGKYTNIRKLNRNVDSELEQICMKMMAVNPEQRFDSMQAVSDAIEVWCSTNGGPSWIQRPAEYESQAFDYFETAHVGANAGIEPELKETGSKPKPKARRKTTKSSASGRSSDPEPAVENEGASISRRLKGKFLIIAAAATSVLVAGLLFILTSGEDSPDAVRPVRSLEASSDSREASTSETPRKAAKGITFSLDELDETQDAP